VSSQQCYKLIFILILLYSEKQMGETWEPSNKGMFLSDIRGAGDIKVLSRFWNMTP
jgi:hypothetical protein